MKKFTSFILSDEGTSLVENSVLFAVSIVIGGAVVLSGLVDRVVSLIGSVTSIIPTG